MSLKKVFIIFICLILILLNSIYILSISLNGLLYAKTYTDSLEKNNIYFILENNLDKIPMANAIIIPESGMKGLINTRLENCFSYLRSEADMLDLKFKIDKNKIIDSLTKKVEKMPICNEDLLKIDNQVLNCRPANISTNDLINNYILKENPELLNIENIDLAKELDKNNNLQEIRDNISMYKIFNMILLIIIIFLIFILFLIYRNSIKGFLRIIFIILLIPGINVLLIGFLLSNVFYTVAGELFIGPEFMTSILKPVVSDVLMKITNQIKLNGLIACIISLGLLICSFFIQNRINDQQLEKSKKNKNLKSK